MSVKLGEDFTYALKTHPKDIRKIQVYVRDRGFLGKMSEKVLCGRERYVELAFNLPKWMRYDSQDNMLCSIGTLQEANLVAHRNMQIRVLGGDGVIQELLKLECEGAQSTLGVTFDPLVKQERIELLHFPTHSEHQIERDGISNTTYEMQALGME